GLEERRFAVLRMGTEQIQNSEYFRALDEEMENGGYQALLSYLLQYDLSDINLRQIPDTAALREQKVESMSAETSWWFERLVSGELPGDRDGDGCAPACTIFDHYIETARKRGIPRRSAETTLGTFLRAYVPGLKKHRPTSDRLGQRSARYQFPPLHVCRAEFNRKSRSDFEWDDGLWLPDLAGAASYPGEAV
ncbi:MAG: hypothetical protein ABI142_06675, partial [Bryocella sp.]